MSVKQFHHPFQPYTIQQQFMEAVYECIEKKQVGIFESPTGTGKSLSLICGSLTWLREYKRKTFDDALNQADDSDDEPDWMVEHARKSRLKEASQLRDELETRLEAVREKERETRKRHQTGEPLRKRQKHEQSDLDVDNVLADQFLLDDYEVSAISPKHHDHYSSGTQQLMEQLGFLRAQGSSEFVETPEELKIYFCSRTHSQLSQFVGELSRVEMPPGLPPTVEKDESGNDEATVETLKHISLGSRKNLCINTKVNKLSSQTAINERCLELQQAKSDVAHKCPYLPNKEDVDLVLDFRDHALAKVQDIEDLVRLGKKLEVCPYYASRPAISPAEIVTLPYPLILQKTARKALGISLKDHVVIIDEAHNLMDAIEGIHSCQITGTQLKLAKESLIVYLQHFKNRLKGANRVFITQVVRVLDSLLAFTQHSNKAGNTSGTVEASQLLGGRAVDQIDLNQLVRYMLESKLARKVEGYTASTSKRQVTDGVSDTHIDSADVPNLTHVQNFLTALMNPSKEGRFFWETDEGTTITTVRYMLLDPSEHFREIVHDARAVILAGGTMSPMDDYSRQLFPYLPRLSTLSCGHIIPSSSLLVRTVASDTRGPLEFNFKVRSTESTVTRLGMALSEIAKSVKGGMVAFFSSYKYLEELDQRWQSNGTMSKLSRCKPVFRDSRNRPAETTFANYSEAVKSSPDKGALLLSVIGGKLSEGINFSNDLGRCVAVVGLPYPNLETAEWKTKLQYLEDKAITRGEAKGKASREHAENVCMRAVNQAIGRVIRHKNDWASIVLLGAPYSQAGIRAKLPGWIREGLEDDSNLQSNNLESAMEDLQHFFAKKRNEV